MAVVIILSFVGTVVVSLTEQLKRVVLHWAD
jgi:hypothetical protein